MTKFGARASLLIVLVSAALISVSRGHSNFQRSEIAANESAAVALLRTLSTACITYVSAYGGYPSQLADLGPGNPPSKNHADLIDAVLASGKKSGYAFTYIRGTRDLNGKVAPTFSFYADPIMENRTGTHHFYMDGERGTIYAMIGKP